MLQPLSLLGGLIHIPMWAYNCVLTNAQIELICADIPVINYGKASPEGGGKVTRREVEETLRVWNEKIEKEKGRKISLTSFLESGTTKGSEKDSQRNAW